MTGNSFHGPVAFQTGAHSTLNVNHYDLHPSPLDAPADELARVVGVEWDKEAQWRRLLVPAPLPVRWRVTHRKVTDRVAGATAEGRRARFTPLPGLSAVTREQLRRGGGLTELHAAYGGLASGRILLVGPPAAGKSAAAALLLLDALRHRAAAAPQDRACIPVPVLLTLDGWDPSRESPTKWAADQLARRYTLFQDRGGREQARRLLESGRVALFLDGLDEIGGKLRNAMVSALEQAPFRLILISRAKEAVLTAKRGGLGGAVALEILPLTPPDAAEYLLDRFREQPPPAWRAFTEHLLHEPGGAVAEALTSPLAVTLVRDVYAHDLHVDELLDKRRFATREAVEDHLLDRVVAAAYTPRPEDSPRWSAETAERTLRYIARRLGQDDSYDLPWWHIPGWAHPRPRALAVWAAVTVLCGVPSIVLAWMLTHSVYAWLIGIPSALVGGWAAADRFTELSHPQRLRSTQWRQTLESAGWRDIFTRGAVLSGVVEWLTTGTFATLASPLLPGDHTPPVWLCYLTTLPLGFTGVLVTGRGYRIVAGTPFLSAGAGAWYDDVREFHNRPAVAETRSIGPREAWRHHLGTRLVLGLLTGLAAALLTAPLLAWWVGLGTGLASGVSAALVVGAMTGPVSNLAVATALTAVQLSAEEGTPVHLMSFLEDARRRNLLRTSGPVYQFRHARLQKHLASRE
ncbi:hypothetical protein [Streptomyces maremycinicus]|uniref:hypothetical protein n=1 Tax=Streptomyces maremycinicus TaxID=1679753 RepID=UPI000788644F|nr:hypothetical protein [Streptomyces sp. NBRC 110468]